MPAPSWLCDLLGWRNATDKTRRSCADLFGSPISPNIADVGSVSSRRIAGAAYDLIGIPRERLRKQLTDETEAGRRASTGTKLELGVEQDLARRLPDLDDRRQWSVTRSGTAADYRQFRHLASLQRLFDHSKTLRTAIGRDYQVKTDVYVGVDPRDGLPSLLHAAVSCKWSIRSDRVQNVRHEFATLVRNRRGRLPHLVLITAEPQPTRLRSIARGTGEVDAVYHLLFDELNEVIPTCQTTGEQQEAWAELVEQQRIKPYTQLVLDLSLS